MDGENPYNVAVAKWAAAQYGINADEIESVTMVYEPGGAWSSWTFEEASHEIVVRMKDGTRQSYDPEDVMPLGKFVEEVAAFL